MGGLVRFYDNYFLNLGKGVFDLTADTLKVTLLNDTYIPNTGYGTRGGLLNYAAGDVIWSATYGCFFAASVAGTSALGAPTFDITPGASTVDGTVTWVSCGLAPPSSHAVFADVSGSEVTGTGYSAGGTTATATYALSGAKASLGVSESIWTGSIITAKYAVLYKSGTVGALTDPIICYVLLDTAGSSVSSTGGDFRVRFAGNVASIVGGW